MENINSSERRILGQIENKDLVGILFKFKLCGAVAFSGRGWGWGWKSVVSKMSILLTCFVFKISILITWLVFKISISISHSVVKGLI